MTNRISKIIPPPGVLDSVVFKCMPGMQKLVFVLVLIRAATSASPGVCLIPFDAFAGIKNITTRDIELTLRAMETHGLITMMKLESDEIFYITVRNWQLYYLK